MIDIEILFKPLEKNVNAVLTIEPLAPLSMVSTMPGSFYKTLSEPSKFHIFGAFENALGWHFDEKIRREIRKKISAFLKKLKIPPPIWNNSEVGYIPLIEHILEIKPSPFIRKNPMFFYIDLWKQQRKRADGYSHPNGTMNISYEIIPLKMGLERDTKKGTVTNSAITDFYVSNRDKYPTYYSSVGNREFVVMPYGTYSFHLSMSDSFWELLQNALLENNISYLGTNEGWVNLKIHKI